MAIDPGRVKALFQAAIEWDDPVERQAFLDREVGDDLALRDRLDALLAAYDEPPNVLDQPLKGHAAAETDAFAAVSSQSPNEARTAERTPGHQSQEGPALDTVIADRYKLRQEIGEGGMGCVYLAMQTKPVKRQVALKLIKAGMDSKTVLARFESERQALALMDHPHIAKVLDAGSTEQGRPFFVMELVKGISLTAYCDQHRLDLSERLALFRQVCSAVQHAHQKGIIHRDLKPTNILVEDHDGTPVPKVIDFGLAKATSGMALSEHSLFTAFGTVTGTPLYMAPEQASFSALDVDTRADIYALGVILYELLTGSTPIRRETLQKVALDEILRVVREVEPPTPSSRISTSATLPSLAASRHVEPARLSRLVRGDLDWIVMKALAKERHRRYDSAIGLADDVERFTNHEPVAAGPPTAAYRVRKFVRRNRSRVAAVALVLSALLIGIVGTTVGMLRARAAERAVLAESRRANDERDHAMQAESVARARSEEAIAENVRADEKAALAEAVSEFLRTDILAATAFTMARSGNRGAAITVAEAVDLAAARVGERFADRPLIEAMVRSTMGNTYLELDQLDKAADQMAESVRLFRRIKGEDDGAESVRAVQLLAWIRLRQGRLAESRELHSECLRRAERSLPAESKIRLIAMAHYAHCLAELGEFGAAAPMFERAIAAQLRAKGESRDLQMIRNNLALMYSRQGRFAEAEPICLKALAEHRRLAGDLHPNTLLLLRNLAAIYCALARWDAAEPPAREALVGARKALRDGRPPVQEVESLSYLSQVFAARGRAAEHRVLVADILATLEPADGASFLKLLQYAIGIADRARALGDGEQAARVYRAVARIGLAESGRRSSAGNLQLSDVLAITGASFIDVNAWDEAEPLLRACLAIREKSEPNVWTTFNAKSMLGATLLGQKYYAEAEPLLRAGYEGMKERVNELSPQAKVRLRQALDRLITLAEATNKPDEAKVWRDERSKLPPEASKPRVERK